ncbi:FecR family protein [Puia sp.]|uniref:FecR family protein n=1 Tax=Puia sp. TaxID=2045100 RepID=UPI002F427AF2
MEKHLTNNATSEEVQQLLQMIKSGLYDKLLKQRIDDALLEGRADRDMSLEPAHRLLYKIFSTEEKTDKLIPNAKPFNRYRVMLPAAAALVLVAVAGWLLWSSAPRKTPLAKTETPTPAVPADTDRGKFIHLPDGSTVLLRGGSQLTIGAAYNTRTREVTLTGEGYFDIHPDDGRPFVVHAKAVNTTVLGTAFNVCAWPARSEVVVTVTRGKVRVSDPQRTYGVISSNEQIAVDAHSSAFINQTVDADSIVAWKKDYLVLDSISLAEAARLIGHKYHVNVVLANDALKDCHISASFLAHESLEQVLTVVCAVVEGSYTAQPNDQIIINGKGCN